LDLDSRGQTNRQEEMPFERPLSDLVVLSLAVLTYTTILNMCCRLILCVPLDKNKIFKKVPPVLGWTSQGVERIAGWGSD